jgi:hypothetical protein
MRSDDEITRPGIPTRATDDRRTSSGAAMYVYQLAQEALTASARWWLAEGKGSAEGFREQVRAWLTRAVQFGKESRDEEVRSLTDKVSQLESILVIRDATIERLRAARDPRRER